ncbi:PQQ-binding-like beta-propeller repeat protein [Nocardia sp. XZ_19_385]|uniref:PQQ-binding-like beta-propeller repeat protein n=1 Tax=Nocardia sp. XZ_19_385 TaxID=2769488 RepID=UPI00188FC9CD|nr:PQQ-binding-like beta-propeller repeat protein [Nocardia sp. XZ_19_385]
MTSSAILTVERVLGEEPFAEIGMLGQVVTRGEITVAAGDVGRLRFDIGSQAGGWSTGWQLGVYGPEGRCRHLMSTGYPVHSIDIHPTLPLIAIGVGDYDGGYFFEGELLLLDAESGRLTRALRDGREVRKVQWHGEQTLRMILGPISDHDVEEPWTRGVDVKIERSDWSAVSERSIDRAELSGPEIDCEQVTRRTNVDRTSRRQVWDMARLADGRVLAALGGVQLESWLPSGEREWVLTSQSVGRQIEVCADQQSAWTNTASDQIWTSSGLIDPSSSVARVSLADGQVIETLAPGFPVIATMDTKGWLALRNSKYAANPTEVVLIGPDNQAVQSVTLGRLDALNYSFQVRRASTLYFVAGSSDSIWNGTTQVVSVDATSGTVTPLFPLAWEDQPDGYACSAGPAIQVRDAVIHAGAISSNRAALPGNRFVVRRHLRDGAPEWVFTADYPITALDGDDETVFITLYSGELLALDAATGEMRWRQPLAIREIPVVPMSLVAEPSRLLIGTLDGRILDCSVRP